MPDTMMIVIVIGNGGSPPMRQAVELGAVYDQGYFASRCFIFCISFAWRTKALRP